MKLQGKTAIVTGASRGIGWEVALAYAREGADVVVSARSEDSLRELVERIAELQQRAIAVTADVGDATDVEKLVNTTVDTFGKVDILCNNAGLLEIGEVDQLPTAAWDRVMRVNARGPFLCSQSVLPIMKSQNYGRIVNMSSGAAIRCAAGYAAYSASKAALNALSLTTAIEVEDYEILVNAMSPGYLKTAMNPDGTRPPTDAVPTAVMLASLPSDGPRGRFFRFEEEMIVIPESPQIDWTK